MYKVGIGFLLLFLISAAQPGDFKKDQLRYARVRTAFKEKDSLIGIKLNNLGVQKENLVVFLRALKHERKLEVWVKNLTDEKFQLYKQFQFCSFSGDLGPKRQQGDGQIPEGLYTLDIFNPFSSFYLSMGTSYPNQSDRIRKTATDPGGDIYIHGNCVTIGCIPITDDGIKELYTLCVLAKDADKSAINVHFFPFKMNTEQLTKFSGLYAKHKDFWNELAPLFSHFETNKKIPNFNIDSKGKYKLN